MRHMKCTCRVIADERELASCRDAWNDIAGDRVCLSWDWLSAWWQEMGQGELAIVVVEDGLGQWVGLAPWYKTRVTGRGRVIYCMGNGMACSDYVGAIAVPGYEAIVAEKILEKISSSHPLFSNVDLFEIEGYLKNDPVMRRLCRSVSAGFAEVIEESIGGVWKTELKDDWEEYQGALRKSFRRKTRKATSRLLSNSFQVKTAKTTNQINQLWPTFVELHQRRRESLGQAGCFADPNFDAFLKLATLRLGEAGRTQLQVIYHEGVALASLLGFKAGDSLCLYQTGVDPECMDMEPGHINFCSIIQLAIKDSMKSVDFMRGDEPYKRFWNTERADLFRTRWVPRRFSANLRYSLITTGQLFRNWVGHVGVLQEC